MPVLSWQWSCGCNDDGNTNQLKAESVMATVAVTATVHLAAMMTDAQGRGLEVIGLGGVDEYCGADAGSLSMAVMRLQRLWKRQST
jgi:hypothetical protein